MVVRGQIRDINGTPLQGVKVDVWQANDEGFYDVQQQGLQPDFNLRGMFTTGEDGTYWFKGVRPRHYAIPDDGPVGDLLNALGRHPNRPAHLHFIVSKDGYEGVTTHIFDPDDPYIDNDAVLGVKESLIATFEKVDDPSKLSEVDIKAPHHWEVAFDFVLTPEA